MPGKPFPGRIVRRTTPGALVSFSCAIRVPLPIFSSFIEETPNGRADTILEIVIFTNVEQNSRCHVPKSRNLAPGL